MTVVVLVRHGRSTANSARVLAGRSDGVDLDEQGLRQAEDLAGRLAALRPDRLVSSPLPRCRQTLTPLAERLGLPIETDDRFVEVDYGSWTGRPLADLAQEPLWRVVQGRPSRAVFPDGEGLAEVSVRAVGALRDLADAGDDQVVVVCTHGDVIATLLADALGIHLDGYQRVQVAPGSVSVLRCSPDRVAVERFGDTGPLTDPRPPLAKPEDATAGPVAGGAGVPAGDAVVGGPTD